jgi:hypothetical protein
MYLFSTYKSSERTHEILDAAAAVGHGDAVILLQRRYNKLVQVSSFHPLVAIVAITLVSPPPAADLNAEQQWTTRCLQDAS